MEKMFLEFRRQDCLEIVIETEHDLCPNDQER